MSKVQEYIKPGKLDVDPKYYIYATLGIHVLLDLWYFYLCRRFCSGKSKGILLAILLILSVGGYVAGFLFSGESLTSIPAILDILALVFFVLAKKIRNKIISLPEEECDIVGR
ncbi:MAG: hypothetical protein K6E47_16555 [Lachnospiraceae bacterium]|nr:hypothetical protein [Lachnospiraceae bacterium]